MVNYVNCARNCTPSLLKAAALADRCTEVQGNAQVGSRECKDSRAK